MRIASFHVTGHWSVVFNANRLICTKKHYLHTIKSKYQIYEIFVVMSANTYVLLTDEVMNDNDHENNNFYIKQLIQYFKIHFIYFLY